MVIFDSNSGSESAVQVLKREEKPTNSFGQAVDSLAVGVRLVPDEGIGQVGLSWEPFLEEPAHHCHHQVNLKERPGTSRTRKWSKGRSLRITC